MAIAQSLLATVICSVYLSLSCLPSARHKSEIKIVAVEVSALLVYSSFYLKQLIDGGMLYFGPITNGECEASSLTWYFTIRLIFGLI